MTPGDYERLVAAEFDRRGFATRISGGTGDWGVDIFAEKGTERLAVQAKMYGGNRPVNRRQVFELFGVAAYFDCTGSVIATDGSLATDALAVAKKLGIEVLELSAQRPAPSPRTAARGRGTLTFDELWERSILPLVGQVLTRADGSSNTILVADWSGVQRQTSNGRTQMIPIEIFRWAIERVLETGSLTRDEVNAQFEGRASSGIVLILGAIPEFLVQGRPLAVSLRKASRR